MPESSGLRISSKIRTSVVLALFIILCHASVRADDSGPKTIELREAVVLSPSGRGGRSVFHVDAIEALVVAGQFHSPKDGDEVKLSDGSSRAWKTLKAGADGTFQDRALGGGYASIPVESETDRVMILEASGHGMVYVNGEPRAGDPYSNGSLHLPVKLRKGTNHFLFTGGRGTLRARLVAPKAQVFFDLADVALPELTVGQEVKTLAGIVVVNASEATLTGGSISATIGDKRVVSPLPALPPLSIRKLPVSLEGIAPKTEGTLDVAISLSEKPDGDGSVPVDTAKVSLAVRPEGATVNQTFLSKIDGSVQYYGLVPALPDPEGKGRKPGLILSLHGAGVEGAGQARVYGRKPGLHLVAPTNRRPFGFDWEDWGRIDAMEVLDLAQKTLDTDPRRTYLTGHSMGGHGTWHLGVTYPDRFAAIAPSAGWVSMFSYAGMKKNDSPSAMEEILQRAAMPSDTLALATNLAKSGVYVLHGDADDNVPVGQARNMRQVLSGFHPDFAYYERPGAGHWWGNECCDWPPLIEFLARHELPEEKDVRRVDFRTASPGVSARSHWATIEAQRKSMAISRVQLAYDPEKRRFSGTTENVARLSLDITHVPPGAIEVELDGKTVADVLRPEGETRLGFSREGETWKPTTVPTSDRKSPIRSGPFKDAFRNRMLFVYGTKGTAEENAWSFAKVRFDAESFGYRGNGSVEVVADSAFDPRAEPDRNVIVYGHSESNAAWDSLLVTSPVQVRRGSIKVGDREVTGDNLACVFLRPRPASAIASIGVVTGSSPSGMRLTDRLPIFISGVGFPDLLVLGPDVLEKGVQGVRVAGYFGEDWGVSGGEILWRE